MGEVDSMCRNLGFLFVTMSCNRFWGIVNRPTLLVILGRASLSERLMIYLLRVQLNRRISRICELYSQIGGHAKSNGMPSGPQALFELIKDGKS